MSSVRDRIRRLQSADDAPPRPAPRNAPSPPSQSPPRPPAQPSVSSLTSRFAADPQSPARAAASSRPVAELATALEHSEQSGAPRARVEQRAAAFSAPDNAHPNNAPPVALHARITRLESGVDSAEIAARVRRLESAGDPRKLTAGAVAGPAVSDARGAFERSPDDSTVTDDVRKRAGAFERTTPTAEVTAPDGDHQGDRLSPRLTSVAAVFERSTLDVADDAAPTTPRGSILGKAAVFEAANLEGLVLEKREDGGNKTQSAVLKRAGVFERVEPDKKDVKEPSDSKVEVARSTVLQMEKRAQQAQDKPSDATQVEEAKPASTAASLLTSRAAMFEKPPAAERAPSFDKPRAARPNKPKVETRTPAVKTTKDADAAVSSPKSELDELQEVKAMNRDLVSRLIELTSAFKQLEKSREELQTRISGLEKK